MAHHTVSHQCVYPLKESIIEIKTARAVRWLCGKPLIFVPKLRKMLSQQFELHGVVHVYADKLARLIPQAFGKGLGIRNRLVKVHWRHVKTMSLPNWKNLPKLSRVHKARDNCRDKA